jgi:hypothetical protein
VDSFVATTAGVAVLTEFGDALPDEVMAVVTDVLACEVEAISAGVSGCGFFLGEKY